VKSTSLTSGPEVAAILVVVLSTQELNMRDTHVTLPELGLIAGTRAALGAGLALLLGDRLQANERRVLGWALTIFGVATTIPLAAEVLGKSGACQSSGRTRDMMPAYAG
jgi:hypothetical protein